jgi:AcrR family transcriptional regulator
MGSAEDTKRRILEAAAEQFAAHGIAGARTGNIAECAGVNEALLYRYFGNKRSLFGQVYAELVAKTIDDVPMDTVDLPEYAGRLFDHYRAHPDVVRLAVWVALEGHPDELPPELTAANAAKIDAIAKAQARGRISRAFAPDELLQLVVQLSLAGAPGSPTSTSCGSGAVDRASVVRAVNLLTQCSPDANQVSQSGSADYLVSKG